MHGNDGEQFLANCLSEDILSELIQIRYELQKANTISAVAHSAALGHDWLEGVLQVLSERDDDCTKRLERAQESHAKLRDKLFG